MNILECNSITKRFGAKTALNNVNLKLESGKIVGLLGPNGSGKTTLIKIINKLLIPDNGEVTVGGEPIGVKTKNLISYLPDRYYLSERMTAEELIKMFGDFYADFDKQTAVNMLHSLGIDMRAKLKTLSKGTKEKVQLIMVMSRRAKLYLLDEPIGGVDPATRDYIINSIIANYSEEATVVLSTHLITDVEKILDEVVFIRNGEIVLHDAVDNLREREGKSVDAVFREVFKC